MHAKITMTATIAQSHTVYRKKCTPPQQLQFTHGKQLSIPYILHRASHVLNEKISHPYIFIMAISRYVLCSCSTQSQPHILEKLFMLVWDT
mmetsp:Transcript_34085/g.54812  ORF Transcript_34085/g.54812 Transcript_34085/m.54812 type:complete len:91 (-) Transcript_34085:290-562(-)